MRCDQPLLTALNLGADISVRDNRLVITARSPLPEELIAGIRAIRHEIIEAWCERAAVRQFDGGFRRSEAESLASRDITGLRFDPPQIGSLPKS